MQKNYWKKIADKWDTTEDAAKKSNVQTVLHLMFHHAWKIVCLLPISDDDGRLGYCWMHHFKCHSARTCDTWAKGGPIKDDKISYDWQELQT